MRKIVLISAALLLLTYSSVYATTVQPCVAGTLADYEALPAGCSVGGLLFSDFNYTSLNLSGNAPVVPASEVTVVPIENGNRSGLSFRGNWIAAFGAADHLIFYEVSTLSGLPTITDAYLDWTAFRIGAAVASLDEFLCVGGTWANQCADGQGMSFYLRDSFVPSDPSNQISFGPTSRVAALKDVFVLGIIGAAGIFRADNEWGQIPEPASLALMGVAAALVMRARRKRC